jgi:hypothetical protein
MDFTKKSMSNFQPVVSDVSFGNIRDINPFLAGRRCVYAAGILRSLTTNPVSLHAEEKL